MTTDCPHGQGQHWLGDCGDMLDYIAIPTTVATTVGQTVLDTLTEYIGAPTTQFPTLGPIVMSIR